MWRSHSPLDKRMLMSGTRSAGRTKSGSAMRSNAAVLSSNAGCTAAPPGISPSRFLPTQLCPCVVLLRTTCPAALFFLRLPFLFVLTAGLRFCFSQVERKKRAEKQVK